MRGQGSGRARIKVAAIAAGTLLLAAAGGLRAQTTEVILRGEKIPHEKINISLTRFVAAAAPDQEAAREPETVLEQDLRFSGLFRVARPGAPLPGEALVAFSIEGTVEGAGPGKDGEAPLAALRLLTHPQRQMLLEKRYRPRAAQRRASAHHFANQVVEYLTGESGIALTRICFSRGRGDRRDLYVIDYDGANLLRLTANRTLNLRPAWSPDGAKVAFTSYDHGQQGIYLLETATGKVQRIIAGEGLNLGADFHPSGKQLVVSLSRSGDPEIYRIDLAGKLLRRLTVSPAIEVSADFSPSGLDVLFTSDRTGSPQIYVMDAEGAGRRRLTFEGRYNDSAEWSPKGDRIIYATREANYTQLVMVNATGENRQILTDAGWRNCEDPSWAPNGRHVVFASDRTGSSKLWVLDTFDLTARQLTRGEEPDITASWSP